MNKIPITIADITIELHSTLSVSELGIEKRLGSFINGSKKPNTPKILLQWVDCERTPEPKGELIYNPGSIWKMYLYEGHYYASIAYEGEGPEEHPPSVLSANQNWNDLKLFEKRTKLRWYSRLNTGAGELILRAAILFNNGLMFHACGIDDNGNGIVFIGHSGSGKSTQLELWNTGTEVVAMNDDRIAIRMVNNGPICYGTPWGGTAEIAQNHAAPLKAIILLEQAPENQIKQISTVEAAPLISARSFLPYWDLMLMDIAMSNLDNIIKQVPIYRLRCRPEKEVIALVRSVL